jgi:spore coat polysaccharide biosynthesis predicted glycosyltransferase SpsG
LDGHHFNPAYQKAVRVAGIRVLVIDDLAQWPEYHADIVLNQNLAAPSLPYVSDRDTRLLLGMQYVMLRREFVCRRGLRRRIPPIAGRLLVTMGGSDPGNATLKVMRALALKGSPSLGVVVVVGPGNPRLQQLRVASRRLRLSVRFEESPQNMPDLMAWADMALTTAGGTVWELLFMGCPTLSFTRLPVQDDDYRRLERHGVMRCLGNEKAARPEHVAAAIQDLAHSAAARRRMSARGRRLVDGQGAARVARAMLGSAEGARAARAGLARGAEQ